MLDETIVAVATPPGIGGISILRISGAHSIDAVQQIWKGTDLTQVASHKASVGYIMDGNESLDHCVVTIFRAPHSYTGQNTVEISCHASPYITERIMQLCIEKGCRIAEPGEFTQRAYLNGQLDLVQAEAVADLIASQSQAQHTLAIQQLRGGYSAEFEELRSELIRFASLIELENDFGEEDVEFADRAELKDLLTQIIDKIRSLKNSFKQGNMVKNGIPIALVGAPNVGKSSLLNALLRDDRAIVSDIPGTTRDVIEDTLVIDGHIFRLVDTAGIRQTQDDIEKLGIERTYSQMAKAEVICYLVEYTPDFQSIVQEVKDSKIDLKMAIVVINKMDKESSCTVYDVEEAVSTLLNRTPVVSISALNGTNLDQLITQIVSKGTATWSQQGTVLTNVRHYAAFTLCEESLVQAAQLIDQGVASDLAAIDMRHAIQHISNVLGEISTDDLLDSIFRNFCIGK